jgi:hypothetical protein
MFAAAEAAKKSLQKNLQCHGGVPLRDGRYSGSIRKLR